MNAITVFLWFVRTSTLNQVRHFARRLRSPRYAVAVVLGVLYFGFILIGPMLMPDDRENETVGRGIVGLVRDLGGVALLLLTASWWLRSSGHAGVALTPAEANLLVPAPLTRAQLMQFKILTTQPAIIMSAAFISMLTHASPIPGLLRFAGTWVLLATLQLHRYGSSLVRTSLVQQGRDGWRRAWPAVVLFTAMLGAVVVPLVAAWLRNGGLAMQQAIAVLETPPAAVALRPFTAVLAAVNAAEPAAWTRAFMIAAVILVAHYIWVIRTDAAFEEGAADAGARQARILEAARTGDTSAIALRSGTGGKVRAAWFPLAARGEPTVAVLWKNALGVTRGVSRRLFMALIAGGIFAFAMLSANRGGAESGFAGMMGIMALSYGIMITFIGPTRVRHDFRSEVRRMDLLRSLPVGGVRLAAAEVATSTLVLTLLQLALFAVAIACFIYTGSLELSPIVLAAAVPLLVLIVGLNGTMITIHNWFAIVFPGLSSSKPGGVEVFGLTMLTILASMLLFVVSLILPAIAGAAAGMSTAAQWGARAFIPGAGVALLAVLGQLLLLLHGLGRAYDHMDPADAGHGSR